MTTRREIADEARGMPPEPTAPWILLAVAIASALWLGVLAWQVMVLPERVPVHFGSGGQVNRWSSREGALAFSVLLPLLAAYPLPLLSKMAIRWPESINAPNRDWWAASAPRLRRFERLLREDLWLIALLMLGLSIAVQVSITQASFTADGNANMATVGVPLIVFLALTGVIVARMMGSRYAEQEIE